VPKFQAIQAANEVLGDPASKQKYDNDRRKAGIFSAGPTFNPRQPAPGNPYSANSAYPPPPRRTGPPPGTYSRPQPASAGPGPPPSGAERFSNFPRPAPTARADGAQHRTDQYTAWSNINNTQRRQQNFNQPPPRNQPPPQQPQPQPRQRGPPPQPPPRQDPKMPNDPGARFYNAPRPEPEPLNRNQSAWQAYQNSMNAPKPGLNRTSSVKTPNRQGFNPNNLSGSDEKPSGSHHMHRNRSADFGRPQPTQPTVRVPPPPSGVPPSANPTTPRSPLSPKSQRPFADPTRPFSSRMADDQVPFSEGNRNRTPYSSYIHEKTDLGDGLRRSFSTRDTTKLGPDDAANQSRARSTSPLGRQRASESNANGSGQKKPFVMYSDSEESDADITQSPGEANPEPGEQHRPGTAPNAQTPFERPKKVPTAPSQSYSNRNGTPLSRPRTSDDIPPHSAQPDMEQRSSSNMYDDPLFPSTATSESANNANSSLTSTVRARRTWSKAGRWALPASINPFAKPTKTSIVESQQRSDPGPFVTAADPVFVRAREDERNAYLQFQSKLKNEYDHVPNCLDMDVFLKLASTARKGITCGRPILDVLLVELLEYFPSVGLDQNTFANRSGRTNSFTNIPHHHQTNGKARSAEEINMNFSNDEKFDGTFTSRPEDFAPPTGRKQPSPNGRTPRTPNFQPRSATMDDSTTSTYFEKPQRPFGSDGTPRETPLETAQGGYDSEEWSQRVKDPSFASWAQPQPQQPPRQGSPSKGGATPAARKASQGRRSGRSATGRAADGTPLPQPHVVDLTEEETSTAERADDANAFDDGDAMDIDDTPPTTRSANDAADASGPGKGPRVYSVPISSWRQQQEQIFGQASKPGAGSRPHRASTNDDTKFGASLDDLSKVEPFAKPASGSNGLNNLGDIGSQLPFKSEASRDLPTTSSLSQQHAKFPPVPAPPPEPTNLTKALWQGYVTDFGKYLVAFHLWNKKMLEHFATYELKSEQRLEGGTAWLEAVGETSGISGTQQGFGSYLTESLGVAKSREYWVVGCKKHQEGLNTFAQVKESVRAKAAKGLLPEV
jgi:curved DNA-binding protein CbpA